MTNTQAPDSVIPDHLEHRVRKRDGRTLAVAEWGDPAGGADAPPRGSPGIAAHD